MYQAERQMDDDETALFRDEEPAIDYESDLVHVQSETDDSHWASDLYSDDPGQRLDNADLDNLLDEFVDVVNGRDLDGLAELLAADVEAEFLHESSRDGVVDGFNDLFQRYPTLLVTRGDVDSNPIAMFWILDREADAFREFGYMTFEVTDSTECLIQRVAYVDEPLDFEEIVVEIPERSELPEWEDWSELDED